MGRTTMPSRWFAAAWRSGSSDWGPTTPRGHSLVNLANLYGPWAVSRGRAAPRRSLEIHEKRLGPTTPTWPLTWTIWPTCTGAWADTPRPSRSSAAAWRSSRSGSGADHPKVARSLNNVAILYATHGRWAEAAESIDRDRHILRRHIARVLPALAEAEQLAFLKANDERFLHGALSLALARRDDPDAVGRSAGWVLNGKAVAQEALAQRTCWPATATTPPPPGWRPCGNNWPP